MKKLSSISVHRRWGKAVTILGMALAPLVFPDWAVTIAEAYSPSTNYGVFIGVRDSAAKDGGIDYRGDISAEQLAKSFDQLPNSVGVSLTANLTNGGGLSFSQISNEINNAYDLMLPGDNLFLYFAGHGSSTHDVGLPLTSGLGDEYVRLGTNLSDDNLTTILKNLTGVNKWVFLDSCHSGGFWGPGDILETLDAGDLNRVSKTALLASSSEEGLAYYNDDGWGIISLALLTGWAKSSGGYYAADLDHNGDFTMQEIAKYVEEFRYDLEYGPDNEGEIVYEAAFGDPVAFSRELLSPTLYETSDFTGVMEVSGQVPEPSTLALLGLGLLVLLRGVRPLS